MNTLPLEFNSKLKVKFPDNHSIDHLKFVFTQAEKRLEESNKIFESTTNKTITIIILYVALTMLMPYHFFINNEFRGAFSINFLPVFILCIYTFIVLIYITKNILPHKCYPIGTSPSLALTERPNGMSEELHLKDVYYSELVNYNDRIDHNLKVNNYRFERIRISIICLITLPCFYLLIYTINQFLL